MWMRLYKKKFGSIWVVNTPLYYSETQNLFMVSIAVLRMQLYFLHKILQACV